MKFEYSKCAKNARFDILEDCNQINIYVEDNSYHKLYTRIFSEIIFKGKYEIESVFPIGSCMNFKKKIAQDKNNGVKKPTLYIIDGDLNLIRGKKKQYKELCRLEKYCIENYFLEEDAIISMLDYEDCKESRKTLKTELDFNNWINNNIYLLKLFIFYASIPQKSGIPTVAFGLDKLLPQNKDKSKGIIDAGLCKKRIEDVKKSLKKNHLKACEKKNERLLEKIDINQNNFLKYISGKEIMKLLLNNKLKSTFKKLKSQDIQTLTYKIALKCKLEELKDLLFKHIIMPNSPL